MKSGISPFIELKISPFEMRIVFHTFRVKFHPLKFRVYWLRKSREGNNNFPTYQEITNIIENRARTQNASRALNQSKQSSNRPQGGKLAQYTKSSTSVQTTVAKPNGIIAKCASCNNENHFTFRCPKFLQMTVPQRRAFISLTGGCFNYFSGSHIV